MRNVFYAIRHIDFGTDMCHSFYYFYGLLNTKRILFYCISEVCYRYINWIKSECCQPTINENKASTSLGQGRKLMLEKLAKYRYRIKTISVESLDLMNKPTWCKWQLTWTKIL